MNQAQALYHLQTIDLTLAAHQNRAAEIRAQLGANEPVVAAEQTLLAAEEALAPWKNRVLDLELEIKSLAEKMTGVEQRLYSGSVSNPKELGDMQNEVASLKRRRAKLEDDLLEAMIEVESAEATCVDERGNLDRVQTEWENGQQGLLMEQREFQGTVADLEKQRELALQSVSAESLDKYNTLAPRKRGHAVAEIEGATCKVCGVSQTSILVQQLRQSDDFVYCAGCERILVAL